MYLTTKLRHVICTGRGLHDYLYGSEEDHGAAANDAPVEMFDGSSLHQARLSQVVDCEDLTSTMSSEDSSRARSWLLLFYSSVVSRF